MSKPDKQADNDNAEQDSDQAAVDDMWCVIPVFNNARTVKDVATECRRRLPRVVVVDDGSEDADVATLLGDTDIHVVKHRVNRGKNEALLTGLRYVQSHGARFMITLAADGRYRPADIPLFIPLLRESHTRIVVGARDLSDPAVPRASRLKRTFSDFWLRLETNSALRDSRSGFRAYPVEPLARLLCERRRCDFETEALVRASWAGLELRNTERDVRYLPGRDGEPSCGSIAKSLRRLITHARLIGRRLVPWPHKRLVERKNSRLEFLRHPRRFMLSQLRENASPGGLAAAAAVGSFLAVLPLISMHMAVILYVTARLHLNKVMALAIQNLFMPPLMPLVCVELGYYMRTGHWLLELSRETVLLEAPIRLWEWLLGSLVMAPVMSVVTGGLVFLLASAMQKTAAKKESNHGGH